MERSANPVCNAMRLETLKGAGMETPCTLHVGYQSASVYAVVGRPGLYRRIKRAQHGHTLTHPQGVLALFQGHLIELYRDPVLADEIREAYSSAAGIIDWQQLAGLPLRAIDLPAAPAAEQARSAMMLGMPVVTDGPSDPLGVSASMGKESNDRAPGMQAATGGAFTAAAPAPEMAPSSYGMETTGESMAKPKGAKKKGAAHG